MAATATATAEPKTVKHVRDKEPEQAAPVLPTLLVGDVVWYWRQVGSRMIHYPATLIEQSRIVPGKWVVNLQTRGMVLPRETTFSAQPTPGHFTLRDPSLLKK